MKKFKIDFKTCLVFIVAVLVFHMIGSSVFPVDEEANKLLAPDWYPIACMLFALGMSLLFYNRKKLFKKKRHTDLASNDLTEDIEKWKVERGRINAPPYTTYPPSAEKQNSKSVSFSPIQPKSDDLIEQGLKSLETTLDALEKKIDALPSANDSICEPDQRTIIELSTGPRSIELNKETNSRVPHDEVDYMQQIVKMENRFKSAYTFAQQRALNLHERERIFISLCRKYQTTELSLPCQIRFEQLKAEYEPKFNNPDPMMYIDSMEGHDFEYWCADLLKKLGYQNVQVTPGSGDQGVDVLAEKEGVRYAIQCKCYSKDLGNGPIQEVETGRIFYGCHVGAVMTNRYFTKGAKVLAGKTRTLLWDRDYLIQVTGV